MASMRKAPSSISSNNGVAAGWYPPSSSLGIGAMTDFSALIANPN